MTQWARDMMTSVVFSCKCASVYWPSQIFLKMNMYFFTLMHLWWFYRRYLKDEHKAKKGVELDGTKWTIGSLRASVSQVNGCMQHSYCYFSV